MWIINTHFLVDNVESQKQGVTKGRVICLIHVDVWQKTAKFCKAIILQ